MEGDGGWKKTLRNFGVESKRAIERTAQAVTRMGATEKSNDPDPNFKHIADLYNEQTTSLKCVRDASNAAVEALARVAGAGATLAAALQAAIPSGSSYLPHAERHLEAQRNIADNALRKAERRIHAKVESPIEDEITQARDISARMDQRRKVASDYRRYRARLDDFSGNDATEDAIKADDKLRELNVLAESLTNDITTAMPRRAALIEQCTAEISAILCDFHKETAAFLEGGPPIPDKRTNSNSPNTPMAQVDDLFGDPPASSPVSETQAKPNRNPELDALKARENRRAKSAYIPGATPVNSAVKSTINREARRSSARAPDYYNVANSGTASSNPTTTAESLLGRRGNGSSGYPSGGVGQRESTFSSYPTGGVGQRESTTASGEKTSVYPSRRAAKPSRSRTKPEIPRSESRDSGLTGKSSASPHTADDLLGSFGGSTQTSTTESTTRPPRQRRSAGNSAPSTASHSLDDLFNFTANGTSAASSAATGTKQSTPVASSSEGDLLGSFNTSRPAPQQRTSRSRQKSRTPPTSSSGTNLQREELKAKSEAEIKAKAAAKLAAVRERENAKEAEREKKDGARAGAERKVLIWTGNGARRGNLRALLASLDTVLYAGHTWKPVSMDVLKIPAKVKLNYRKAILQVHPDKVGSKNLTPDQQMLAELIFDELQNGYEVFTAEQEGKPPPAGSVGPKKSAGGGMGGNNAGFGNSNPAAGMYNGMGRGFGMNGMGGGAFGNNMGRTGMGGMGGMGNMGGGMGGMGRGAYGNMYGAQAGTARPFGAGRAYGMGMNQQQRR